MLACKCVRMGLLVCCCSFSFVSSRPYGTSSKPITTKHMHTKPQRERKEWELSNDSSPGWKGEVGNWAEKKFNKKREITRCERARAFVCVCVRVEKKPVAVVAVWRKGLRCYTDLQVVALIRTLQSRVDFLFRIDANEFSIRTCSTGRFLLMCAQRQTIESSSANCCMLCAFAHIVLLSHRFANMCTDRYILRVPYFISFSRCRYRSRSFSAICARSFQVHARV